MLPSKCYITFNCFFFLTSFRGSFLQSCLVAVVVPEKDPVQKWADKNDVDGDINSWCTNEVKICLRNPLFSGKYRFTVLH